MSLKFLSLCFVLFTSAVFAESAPPVDAPRMGMQRELMGKMLDESTAISAEVKAELRSMHQKYAEERRASAERVRAIRMELAEKLLDPNAKASDLNKLKKEFKKLEEKRIEASLKMLEQATKLLKPTKPTTDADKVFNKHLHHLLYNENL